MSKYEECGQCKQYVNTANHHYDVVKTPDGVEHYLHHDFCSIRYQEEHNCTVLEQHTNRQHTYYGGK